jgi:hypothetical protein
VLEPGTRVDHQEGTEEATFVDTFRVVVTILVLLGVALLILLFEKKRAKRIERDLKDMADEQRRGRERHPDD